MLTSAGQVCSISLPWYCTDSLIRNPQEDGRDFKKCIWCTCQAIYPFCYAIIPGDICSGWSKHSQQDGRNVDDLAHKRSSPLVHRRLCPSQPTSGFYSGLGQIAKSYLVLYRKSLLSGEWGGGGVIQVMQMCVFAIASLITNKAHH